MYKIFKLKLTIALLAILTGNHLLSQNSQAFTTSGPWLAPTCITTCTVQCWGGGGAGGSSTGGGLSASAGGGGAGGAYIQKALTITPGNSYNVTVGVAQATSGTAGNDSWFGSATTAIAKGGAFGANAAGGANGAGGVGTTAGSIGDIVYAGGDGAVGNSSGTGGAGGGSAGAGGPGGSTTTGTAGVGGPTGGGAGGAGVANNAAGNAGQNPGGGGSGGSSGVLGAAQNGGAGANGFVIVIWPTSFVSVNSPFICSGQSTTLSASGATSYTWMPGGTTGSSLTVTPPGTTSYTVTGVSTGCTGTAVATVTVYSPVQVNGSTICVGGTAKLTASGAASYLWSNGATTASINISPTLATSYTVTGTSCGVNSTAVGIVTVNNCQTISFTTAGATTWTAPTCVSSVIAEVWGGGGGGGGGGGTGAGTYSASGGGGGAYSKSAPIPVVAGTVYNIFVGAGGSAGTGTNTDVATADVAGDGGDSYFLNNTTVLAKGGKGGVGGTSITLGLGGAANQGVGALKFSGGNGGSPYIMDITSAGAGGGSSAGTSADGNNGTDAGYNIASAAGGAAPVGGGAGGAGGGTGGNILDLTGSPGSAPGGGGGGGNDDVNLGKGAAGAAGQVMITFTIAPQVVTVNSAFICTGTSATLTASGATNYTWSPGTGLSATTGTSVTANPTVTTTYTVTGNTAGCTGSAVSTVTFTNCCTMAGIALTSAVKTDSQTICINTPITAITYAVTGGGTGATVAGLPTGATGSFAAGNVTISGSPSVTGTFNYTVTTSGGCAPVTATGTITVNPIPTITVNSTTICAGQPSSLMASGAASYTWSNGTTGNPLTITAANTTSYTVSATVAGCSDNAVGTINVNQLQSAAFTYSLSTVCKAGGTDPTPAITGTPSGTFTCTPATTIDAATGVITLSVTPVNTYTVTYTTPGPCADTNTFVLNIVNVPVADFTLGTYCQNVLPNPIPAYFNNGGAGTFSAPTGLVFVTPVVTPGQVDLMGSIPGTYTVTNSISSPGCTSATSTATITINAVPNTLVDNQTVCSGTSTTLTASGAASYLWSDGATTNTLTKTLASTASYTVTGTTANCSSSATGTITVNPIPTVTVNSSNACGGIPQTITASGATTYSWSAGTPSGPGNESLIDSPVATTNYVVTGTTNGCTASNIGTITVNPTPTITAANSGVCSGSPATITANSTLPATTTYFWVNTSETTSSITVNPPATITYTVIGTALGCSGTAMPIVTLSTTPTVTITNATICTGQVGTLIASGATTYVWSPNIGSSATVSDSPLITTQYNVTGIIGSCSGTNIGTINVNPMPTVTVNSAFRCAGQPATLIANGASNYLWSDGSVVGSITKLPAATTSYTVIGNPAGCSAYAVGTINVSPVPFITATSTPVCSGSPSVLTANGASSYLWSNGANGSSITVYPKVPTTYTVTGTNGGCSSSAIDPVDVSPLPKAQFFASPNPAKLLTPIVNFTNSSSQDVNYWFWSFGDGDSLSPNTPSPMHTYSGSDTATYVVTLIVKNSGMCSDTISHLAVIGPEFAFYIPNAFTPDGDGLNDVYLGTGTGILDYQLSIFDRWGNFIFYTSDIKKSWDGKANGGSEVAQQDVYVWKVKLKDVYKKDHNYVGTVTLLKGK